MRRPFFAFLLILILPSLSFAQSQNADPEAAKARAQEILKQCREALGGEANLSAIKSLQVNGNFRAAMAGREVQGDFKIEMLMPDKFLRTSTMSMGPMEITRIEAINGEQAWTEMKTSTAAMGGAMSGDGGQMGVPGGGAGGGGIPGTGGIPGGGAGGSGIPGGGGGAGGGVGGPGGGMGGSRGGRGGAGGPMGMPGGGGGGMMGSSPEDRAAMQRQVRADFNRYLVAVLLEYGGSSQFNYSYEREMEAKDGKADAISVTGPDGFAIWLLVDQKTHRPRMVAYRAPAPRPPRNQQGNQPVDQDETGEPKMIDYQVFFTDHKQVGNVWLPHKIVKASEGRMIEELKLSKYKINPDLKPNKFEKKK